MSATLGFFAVLSSQLCTLACVPSITEIRKKKSTLCYTAEPYIAALLGCWVNTIYAVLTLNIPVLGNNCISVMANSWFFLQHLTYSKTPTVLLHTLSHRITMATLILLFFPAVFALFGVNSKFSVAWFGICSSFVNCYGNCAQLINIKEILKRKSSASISPPLTAAATFSNFLWFSYNVSIQNPYYLFSSSVGIIAGFVQIALLVKFPREVPHDCPRDQIELPSTADQSIVLGRVDEPQAIELEIAKAC
jgi:uncharacterized protein with PQ loop repeat